MPIFFVFPIFTISADSNNFYYLDTINFYEIFPIYSLYFITSPAYIFGRIMVSKGKEQQKKAEKLKRERERIAEARRSTSTVDDAQSVSRSDISPKRMRPSSTGYIALRLRTISFQTSFQIDKCHRSPPYGSFQQ